MTLLRIRTLIGGQKSAFFPSYITFFGNINFSKRYEENLHVFINKNIFSSTIENFYFISMVSRPTNFRS